jgi:hypothetical protein
MLQKQIVDKYFMKNVKSGALASTAGALSPWSNTVPPTSVVPAIDLGIWHA